MWGDAHYPETEKPPGDTRGQIQAKCDELAELLLRKNEGYGNSALEPIRIFSDAGPMEQLKVRLDDKLSRIQQGKFKTRRDYWKCVRDLAGYCILLLIMLEREGLE